MACDPALRLAARRPTYEADFDAISRMLSESGRISQGGFDLVRWGDAYLLTGGQGIRHCHLLKEYAIHHLLYCHYTKAG